MVENWTAAIATFCRRRAGAVAAIGLAATLLLGWYTAENFAINTDTETLISSKTDWRKRELAMAEAFPRRSDNTVIVVDAGTPDRAEDAAAALAARLAADPALFISVHRPDGGAFFDRYGMLFLEIDELQQIADRLIEAQPLIGTLTADPSLRGLFGTLNLALEGAARGAIALDALGRPMDAIAAVVEDTVRGKHGSMSWQALLTGREPAAFEKKRFIIVQVALDYGALQPGGRASEAIRAAAAELGLTPDRGVRVRLTGDIPLGDEEFVTVSEGMGVASAVSIVLVTIALFFALKSWRLILCVSATLVAGLAATAAFATAAIGAFNLISVAFAVLFVGIAVDFGIQFSVRFRDERRRQSEIGPAIDGAARAIGGPLTVAAVASALGFFAFLPTDYTGVSELGLIAGMGMLIALALNLTLLPALIALARPGGRAEDVGYAWMAPIDDFLLRRRRRIRIAALASALAGAALLPWLRFDFNPLNLKDPKTESASTVFELMADPMTSPLSIDILAPAVEAAVVLAGKLGAVPEVERAMSVASFVPADQAPKLAIIEDLNFLLGTTFALPPTGAAPTDAENLAAIRELAKGLAALASEKKIAEGERLRAALEDFLALPEPPAGALALALLDGLGRRLEALKAALQAGPVALDTLPPEIRDDWVATDGRARVEVFPKGDARDNAVLTRFAAAVRAATPEISGSALTFQESSRTVLGAFETAGMAALASIAVLLMLLLHRTGDVLLVLAPLGLAAILTGATMVLAGLALNFANIIALPLLLGVGVAFDIYFVMAWRAGRRGPLQSSLARAVLFSGATTGSAFGSLALSSHPGSASMGVLLAIMLFYALLTTLFVLPALLGPPPTDDAAR